MGQPEETDEFIKHINDCEGILQKICRLYFDNEADREDVCQDILLNAWNSFPKFRGEAKFSTWLYQVGINTAMTMLRKKNRSAVNNELSEQVMQIPDEPVKNNADEINFLYRALHELNEVDKTIALLYLDQLSYREIATITGLPEAAMGVRISRVKEKLKKILLKYGIR